MDLQNLKGDFENMIIIKKYRKLVLVISILGIITVMQSISNVKGYYPIEFYRDEDLNWKVKNITPGTNQWYNSSSFSFIANWEAQQNDNLTFHINNHIVFEGKKYLNGSIVLGNLSLVANNVDIGFNLVLSIYPWFGGLVSVETDWNVLKASPPFYQSNITIDESIAEVFGSSITIIEIFYSDSLQKTELVYEKYSGVLIYANTTFSLFNLELELVSSSIPFPSITQNASLLGISCVTLGVTYVLYVTRYKRKTEKK